jgi:hypothetical protein
VQDRAQRGRHETNPWKREGCGGGRVGADARRKDSTDSPPSEVGSYWWGARWTGRHLGGGHGGLETTARLLGNLQHPPPLLLPHIIPFVEICGRVDEKPGLDNPRPGPVFRSRPDRPTGDAIRVRRITCSMGALRASLECGAHFVRVLVLRREARLGARPLH